MKESVFTTSSYGYTLILGLGETGLAAAHWYLQQHLPIRVADTRLHYQVKTEALAHQYNDVAIDVVLGAEALDPNVLTGIQTVVISPGLAPTDPQVAHLLSLAKRQGISVISEIELFARALTDLARTGYRPTVFGVTGTNGKTTVVQLTKYMLQEAGQSVLAAGNISPAALSALAEAYAQQQLPDYWIIELSSFQLEHTFSLALQAGVVLNISQDHIDWHGSMQAYIAAKAHLFSMCQHVIVNRDDPITFAMPTAEMQVQSFGLDQPVTACDIGLGLNQEQEWIALSTVQTGALEYVLPISALALTGRHNISNALAALSLLRTTGLDWDALLHALRNYHGEPHRCQFVRMVQGVSFINDSKGTNVGATVAAIEGLGRSMVLIAGGVGKDQDFTPLADAVAQSACRAVILIGRDAALLARAFEALTIPVVLAMNLTQAVQQAFEFSQAGDTVLLSPACASLDMFSNYIDRGHQFVDAVTELALDKGEVA
ncbi:MAG TPA: UDP-N-acetylmuramoyl-L-alanine--D-glutamate ligase [Paenalcaligenes hominis]|uniref:UDP-N-acetylmuramoylalanine--D-glutamate ligase n=1 Tax=Paenalcaligenes hominis TaxID=643674 RepID=A0A9D2VEU1_9BURK|nr:UDP-N-acetylmuramoyl-L-alanine--D-glutamate ligase [Paenalcaligenes hominis]